MTDSGGTLLEHTMEAIAHAARDSVPGFDHVGVTVVHGDGSVATMASTGALVLDMDTLQYTFDEGPCLDALRRERPVLVEDLPAQAPQWPRYAPLASKAGVRAQMGMPIRTGEQTLGGLNFYATAVPSIDPAAARDAALFAAHAAMALHHGRHADEASQGTTTRDLVGQAVGILMERFEVPEGRAMYFLVRIATAGELELRDAAREVVEQGT